MDLALLDNTVVHGALAGVMLLIAAGWIAWIGAWLRRIELHEEAAPVAAALGLHLEREGWGPSQGASGEVGGVPVRLRWRHGLVRRRVRAAVGGRGWQEVPTEVEAWVREAVQKT